MASECKVCYDTKILEDSAPAGCTHEPSVCLDCLRRVVTCPICRQPLAEFLASRVLARAPSARAARRGGRVSVPVTARATGRGRGVARVRVPVGRVDPSAFASAGRRALTPNEEEEILLARDLALIQAMEDAKRVSTHPIASHPIASHSMECDDDENGDEASLLVHDLQLIKEMEDKEKSALQRTAFNAAIGRVNQLRPTLAISSKSQRQRHVTTTNDGSRMETTFTFKLTRRFLL